MLQVEIRFLKSIMPIFTRVTRLFQAEYSLIHILYDELILLLKALFLRFLKVDIVNKTEDNNITSIDYENEAHYLDKPYIGYETEEIIDKIVEKKDLKLVDIDLFYHRVKKFYFKSCKQLIKTLPLENKILQDLRILNPCHRSSK